MTFAKIFTGFVTALLFASQAHAEESDLSCAALRGLEPVSSHYVKKVLKRADDGLSFGRSGGVADDFDAILPSWALAVGSAWAGLTDTAIQRVQQVDELRNASACLHLDRALIDCKIEEVRQELRAQLKRGSFIAIVRLLSLLEFLNERQRQLRIGALDPEYVDNGWGAVQAFDSPSKVWCGGGTNGLQFIATCDEVVNEDECLSYGGTPFQTLNGCTDEGFLPPDDSPDDTGMMCPFDADYAPAFDSGFGCDIETMGIRRSYPPIQAEFDALNAIDDELKKYREAATGLLKLQGQIDRLFGTNNPLPDPPPPREHLNAFSCGWMGGWCDDDIKKRCSSDHDCADTCVFSDNVCKANRAIRCNFDDQCGDAGPCIEGNESSLRALRGPFSIDKDQLVILSSFLDIRSAEDGARLLPDDLRTAAELPENDPDLQQRRAQQDRDTLYQLFRKAQRGTVNTRSAVQSRLEVMIYPEAVDSPLEAGSALTGLHEAVGEFARLASKKDGVRDFVIRYGSFLQRSCVFRICSLMLEQAIRIATTDACFPYTNGEYLDDSKDDPRWEKCKKGAKIE